MVLKVIKHAGLAGDPVFGKLTTLGGLSHGTVAWIKARYRRTCPGCAQRRYTSPNTLPVCGECWRKVPLDGALWWWNSKRNVRALERLLDAYLDGGYAVPPDPHQLKASGK